MCGGVRGLLRGLPPGTEDFVGPWIRLAAPACLQVLACLPAEEDRELACELETVRLSLRNLMTFPWIAERVAAGQLHLGGAWFDVRTGILRLMQPDGTFATV
jgi:carbonic anhydrase